MLGSVIILWRMLRFLFCRQSLWLDSGCKIRLSFCVWWCQSQLSSQNLCYAGLVCPTRVQLTVSLRCVWFHTQNEEIPSQALFTLGTPLPSSPQRAPFLIPLPRKMGFLSRFSCLPQWAAVWVGPPSEQFHEIQRSHLYIAAISKFCSPL